MKKLYSLIVFSFFLLGRIYADVGNGTIHFVVFADTGDSNVGSSCNQTLKYLKGNLLVKLRRYINDKDVKSYIYEGSENFTRAKLNSTLSSLTSSSNDVIFFYYTGHGFNDGANDYPTLTLGKDGEDLSYRKKELLDVYNTLRGMPHRLLIVMAEACNKQASGVTISDNSPFEDDDNKYRILFSASGDFMISSSMKGQASYSKADNMGIFSSSFADAMSEIMANNASNSVSWSTLFDKISEKTVKKANELKIAQNPQWIQGVYYKGMSKIYRLPSTAVKATTKTTTTTSIGYTPYKHYKKTFNSPDDPKTIGLSLGYVTKQWSISQNGVVEKMGYWDDKKHLTGIQAGIRIEPQFKYGFGINTGLYYEYYFSNTDEATIDDEYANSLSCRGKLEEHNLYLPIHLEYRLHFSDNFNAFFFGGVGLDYGLGGTLKFKDIPGCEDTTFDNIYDNSWAWKRFNTSLEYGFGFRIYGVQIHASMAKGLINMSDENEVKVKMNKNLSVGISFMF